MRFGNFMAPFHPVGQNPTLALERDLDLIVAMDRLGFAEAWVGEHHSAGFEIIASPEVFLGVAAERTKHIKLGTGVGFVNAYPAGIGNGEPFYQVGFGGGGIGEQSQAGSGGACAKGADGTGIFCIAATI